MTVENVSREAQRAIEANPAIQRLNVLLGSWRTEIVMPLDPPIVTSGREDIEWLGEGPFLVMRGTVEHPDFPDGIIIIGADDSNEAYSMLYFDSRGVARIYQMSLGDGTLKFWRETPGFNQRYIGRFSEDGNTITGAWEKSTDGTTWEHDFDLIYIRDNSAQKPR
jgi:hypothetical protein